MKKQQKSKQSLSQITPPTKIDDMILQLRELINQSSSRKSTNQTHPHTNSISFLNPTPKLHSNIESLIEESTKLIQNKKQNQNYKPEVKGKILAASQLLKDQRPLIMNYVKQKIQSQLFTSHPLPEIKKPQLFKLQQEKQALAYQKVLQQQKQSKRRKQIVTSIKQFDSNSRVKIDVHQIDNLIFQQEPQSSYLINASKNDSKKVTSRSNQVKNSNLYISQVYNIHEEEKSLVKSRQNMDEISRLREEGDQEFTEVVEETESHFKYDSHVSNPKTDGLKKVLEKYPHLVKIFYQYLQNQFHIINAKNALNLIGDIFTGFTGQPDNTNKTLQLSPSEPPQGHIWRNQKKKPSLRQKPNQQKISDITNKFKFKGFAFAQENKIAFERQRVSERRINKMNGESKNFHPKKCTLTKKELIYYEEKESADENKFIELVIPENTKFIDMELQRIVSDKFVKEEGSFFSKKEINTEVVTVKGKTRAFKFENNFLEGAQLVNDLNRLMASKVYTICSSFKGLNNICFFDFINNQKSQELNFSSEFMVPAESFAKKQQRDLYIKIISDQFVNHKEVLGFSLSRSKLSSPEISDFVKQFRKLDKLKFIKLSRLRLTKQNFQEICQSVNEIQTNKAQLEVNISDCRLDDDCFISNVGVFTSFCSKVKHLKISDNFFTSKTVQIIKVCLENINTEIRQLNINNCPIRDLNKVNALIKESRKLEILQADNCSLGFDQKPLEQVTKFFDFVKKCNPNLKRISLARNGGLNQEKYAYIENGWNVSTIEQLIVDLNIKMRSEKNQKELLRTDNVAIQKNMLLMKPIFQV